MAFDISIQENNKEPIQTKLNFNNPTAALTIEDVKKIALMKYASISGFGRSLGITTSMASRLLSGSYVPLTPESIRKIAHVLAIDEIVLTQIYTKLKGIKK